MRIDPKQLAQLADLARLRSDAELKRFAAYRGAVEALRAEKDNQRRRMAGLNAASMAYCLQAGHIASLDASRLARAITQLDHDITRAEPGLEAARKRAAREFGRQQALLALGQKIRGR